MMKKHFHNINFAVLLLALFVILWGMWVRLSFSGDGCGDQWPMCQNEWIPQAQESKTWVEWFHRVTSGTFALSILFLFICGYKFFEKNILSDFGQRWLLFLPSPKFSLELF